MTTSPIQQRVNYDAIAHLYDEPMRDYEVDPLLLSFLKERPHLDPSQFFVLDMGCGTGKQLAANRKHFPQIPLVGLDLSSGMLGQARQRCKTVAWMQGNNASLPFQSRRFDYITNQFSYHHVQRKEDMLAEIFRILRPGGRFVMRNIDPWSMPNWVIYQYFPAAQRRDQADFWPAERFTAIMEQIGFANIHTTRQLLDEKENLEQFLAYVRQRHRASQLMVISDQAYARGVQTIKKEIADGKTEVPSDICLITISGDKAN